MDIKRVGAQRAVPDYHKTAWARHAEPLRVITKMDNGLITKQNSIRSHQMTNN